MATFAWFNDTTGFYDLGPPMYIVAEDNIYNNTYNPAFELAYWRLGLGFAETWMERLGEPVPQNWTIVKEGLAKLPVNNGTYKVFEDIEDDFWTDPTYINDHPALAGLYGWLPQTEGLDLETSKLTTEKVWATWNISNVWGWDFPMLAMSAARIGQQEKALEWLLHPLFQFDDAGMPVGGVRVPTPYFPGAGGLLYAIAMMAEGGMVAMGQPLVSLPRDGMSEQRV
ncbi:Six-hairpin glycosidase-like protein [Mycena galericulata]|nr:Six-hairpin glycosidase-like protein [Mycena galericulata]